MVAGRVEEQGARSERRVARKFFLVRAFGLDTDFIHQEEFMQRDRDCSPHRRRVALSRRIRKIGIRKAEVEIFNSFPSRARRAFKHLSLRDLLILGESQLLRTSQFGRKTLCDLQTVLKEYGLTTHMDPGILDDLGFKERRSI